MKRRKFTLLDGGMGRELERMGAPFQQPEWSAYTLMHAPEFIEQAHQSFITAGAEIITVNSYSIVPFHIGQEKFDQDGYNMTTLAAELALNAAFKASRPVKVAGCLPPAFGSYRYDLFDAQKAPAILSPLIKAQKPFVDLWLAETITSIEEAQVISDLLGKERKPLWMSYNLAETQRKNAKPLLRSGEPVEKAIKAALKMGVDAVLFNCSQPEDMEKALQVTAKIAQDKIPYGAYANAFAHVKENRSGNEEITDLRKDFDPAEYREFAERWLDLGATIIGGCCGIGPKHIKALRQIKK